MVKTRLLDRQIRYIVESSALYTVLFWQVCPVQSQRVEQGGKGNWAT